MKLLSPNDVVTAVKQKYASAHRDWLAGGGSWPMTIRLGRLTEAEVMQNISEVRRWSQQWDTQSLGLIVEREERSWPRLGAQSLPAGVVLDSPETMARLAGDLPRWTVAKTRYTELCQRWTAFAQARTLSRYFDELADYGEEDYLRLISLLAWFEANPNSQFYVRQLPVAGIDTKWIGTGTRRAMITDLVRTLNPVSDATDFYSVCGLRKPAHRVRIRVLCPQLRVTLGGLADVEAPLGQVAELSLRPKQVLIVENLETGIALPEMPGTVAFMGMGNAVSALEMVPWLKDVPVFYWGDLDTYGFAILARARKVLPHAQSFLMDEATLLRFDSLWVREQKQTPAAERDHLTLEEQALYEDLLEQTWGTQVRLEQERIAWPEAMAALAELRHTGA